MVAKRPTFEHLRTIAALAAALAVGARADSASAVVVYTNVTAAAGITYKQRMSVGPGALVQTGGAAAADYDNDGWVDLFVTRLDGADVLYRNLGNGTFQNVAAASGFTAGLPTNGPAWGDIDNDGDKDLYVTSCGDTGTGATRFYLYINDGNGHFTEDAVSRGADIGGVYRYGMSATFGDYDGDGYLDIHTNDWGIETADSTSRLLRNLGAENPGHFQDVTAAAGLNVYRPSHFYGGATDSSAYRFASTFTDLDRDGHPDLAITGDFKTSQIFWNNGNGSFTDGTAAAGVGADEDGMGTTIGDFDGDGRMDWFISALVDVPGQDGHAGNFLYRNNGNRTFTDQTDAAGIRNSGWSWGTTFLDHDNDRDLDLFVTNGWDPNNPDQSHVYQNNNGVFTDISNAAGVTDTKLGRGLLSFDYDNDGDLDVFIVNHGNNPILYRNDGGNSNDWLKIKVQGTTSNRDGVGTFITVDPDTSVAGDEIVREINAGNNFLSQNELTAHFGLGPNAAAIDLITIAWPSGMLQQLANVLPNQMLNVVESAGLPGDYNYDLVVDAADYVVWRNQLGSTGSGLAADGNGDNMITSLDYDVWKQHFGDAASGVAAVAAVQHTQVPEPTTTLIVVISSSIILNGLRRGPWRSRTCRRAAAVKRTLPLACVLILASAAPLSGEEPSNEPKPVPATRPEMKAALEALKDRQPRIPLPGAGETDADGDHPPAGYLPATWGLGGFGYYKDDGAAGSAVRARPDRQDHLFADSSFWVVSRGNNCHYCLGHQELKLRAAGLDDDTIASLDSDWSRFDLRQQAALIYARRLTLEPELVDRDEIAALKKFYNDAEIIELTYNISQFNSVNRWTDGMGLPQERYFTDDGERMLATPTSEKYQHTVSIVAPKTRTDRPKLPAISEVFEALEDCRQQSVRVQLSSENEARRTLEDSINDRTVLNWERAMATLPGIGPGQVCIINAIMTDEHLPKRLKAELSLVTSVNNRAWYSAGHAIERLRALGATNDEIASSINCQLSSDASPALQLAAKSTTDPHLITDVDVARVRAQFGDAETAQIMQVICVSNMFDRFTQALGLPLEQRVTEKAVPLR